uniref:Uncharacterized protein n=1 Tax=Branchiostoma floridae TaxID=7739 RepID=C3ZKQ2_BRAFL|eukprot:XP_002590890.1 hypothetical protein BRAFLDRAFT_101158 [Branchiostoma floridae]
MSHPATGGPMSLIWTVAGMPMLIGTSTAARAPLRCCIVNPPRASGDSYSITGRTLTRGQGERRATLGLPAEDISLWVHGLLEESHEEGTLFNEFPPIIRTDIRQEEHPMQNYLSRFVSIICLFCMVTAGIVLSVGNSAVDPMDNPVELTGTSNSTPTAQHIEPIGPEKLERFLYIGNTRFL